MPDIAIDDRQICPSLRPPQESIFQKKCNARAPPTPRHIPARKRQSLKHHRGVPRRRWAPSPAVRACPRSTLAMDAAPPLALIKDLRSPWMQLGCPALAMDAALPLTLAMDGSRPRTPWMLLRLVGD